jgi:hypothetical protein
MAWSDLTRHQIELIKEDLRLTTAFAEANRARANKHPSKAEKAAIAAAEFALVEFEAAHEHELPNVPVFLMRSRGYTLEQVNEMIATKGGGNGME